MSTAPAGVALEHGDGGSPPQWRWERPVLAVVTLLLLSFGLVNLYSASAPLAQRQGLPDTFYLLRQGVGAPVGLLALIVCARIPYRSWRQLAWPLLLLTSAALVILVLPVSRAMAPEINGARRWLDLFGLRFQPSDFAKVAIVVWTAHMAVDAGHRFRSFTRGMLPFLLVWAVLLVPIVLEPDLSTAFVVGTGAAITLFVAGARIGHFVFLAVVLAPLATFLLGTAPRHARILAFRDLAAHAEGAGYQVNQALIAFGSGGVAGAGFGEGRQKFGFVPEPHNDFIFSLIGEEWGLVGAGILIGLYMTISFIGFRIAARAPDRFGQLLATGIASLVPLHAFLHMGVGLGLVPTTGISLPLVSYGRSNLIVTMAGIGILLAVARVRPVAVEPGR